MSAHLSLDLAARLWRCALPRGASKLVLQCFCHHVNNTSGLCWPSIARVALMCGLSERAVQGHVRRLVTAGILRPRLRTGHATRYTIHLDGLVPLVFPTPAAFAATPAENASPPPQVSTPTPAESAPRTVFNFQKNIKVTATPALPDALLLAEGLPPQVLADFAAIRAKKKLGALNATALDALCSQAAIAGLTLAQVLAICCTRNWGRFEAAWLTDTRRSPASSASANPASTNANTVPAPPAGPPPEPPAPPKRAAPEVVAAGRQRLQEIRQTMCGAPAMPAMPTGAREIRIAPDAPSWAVAIVNKQRTGEYVNRTALHDACTVLKLDPASLRRAASHDARTARKPNPAGLAARRMH